MKKLVASSWTELKMFPARLFPDTIELAMGQMEKSMPEIAARSKPQRAPPLGCTVVACPSCEPSSGLPGLAAAGYDAAPAEAGNDTARAVIERRLRSPETGNDTGLAIPEGSPPKLPGLADECVKNEALAGLPATGTS